ncbi:DUF1961 family protein [Agromyces atrinae]|uniref:DUF1961 family protein n=1 Tax=Agromyces atrinae TaxID=592376 RepID=A0A4Q2M0K2_9MICO|nr:DUF1961 family protein [Agromyces atrinae]NYD67058.1 hypothetical protein [Agromyces atrinae]RXZ85219.1 DUF1961 family protein [Agromyces atrinae]RXZ85327.1 DUF1961 family protein [Agromyces atrinae]
MTLLYANPLTHLSDLDDWIAEGPVDIAEGDDGLLLSGAGGIDDHWTIWCPDVFGDRVRITWEFSPRAEPGLAMLFFGASSVAGGGIFDEGLAERSGSYPQYHSSDIRTLHVSYFRRRWEDERAFHTCNLRKSPGFHLVAQGADPLPPVVDAREAFYRMSVVHDRGEVELSIDDLTLFRWRDDGSTGPRVGGGRLGFRQMAPLIACYRNLEVHSL